MPVLALKNAVSPCSANRIGVLSLHYVLVQILWAPLAVGNKIAALLVVFSATMESVSVALPVWEQGIVVMDLCVR